MYTVTLGEGAARERVPPAPSPHNKIRERLAIRVMDVCKVDSVNPALACCLVPYVSVKRWLDSLFMDSAVVSSSKEAPPTDARYTARGSMLHPVPGGHT